MVFANPYRDEPPSEKQSATLKLSMLRLQIEDLNRQIDTLILRAKTPEAILAIQKLRDLETQMRTLESQFREANLKANEEDVKLNYYRELFLGAELRWGAPEEYKKYLEVLKSYPHLDDMEQLRTLIRSAIEDKNFYLKIREKLQSDINHLSMQINDARNRFDQLIALKEMNSLLESKSKLESQVPILMREIEKLNKLEEVDQKKQHAAKRLEQILSNVLENDSEPKSIGDLSSELVILLRLIREEEKQSPGISSASSSKDKALANYLIALIQIRQAANNWKPKKKSFDSFLSSLLMSTRRKKTQEQKMLEQFFSDDLRKELGSATNLRELNKALLERTDGISIFRELVAISSPIQLPLICTDLLLIPHAPRSLKVQMLKALNSGF